MSTKTANPQASQEGTIKVMQWYCVACLEPLSEAYTDDEGNTVRQCPQCEFIYHELSNDIAFWSRTEYLNAKSKAHQAQWKRTRALCLEKMSRQDGHYGRIKAYFEFFPAQGEHTADELGGHFNNLIWQTGETYEDNAKNPNILTKGKMAYYLEKMRAEGLASFKYRTRGWYTRKLWSTWVDIPF